MLSFLGMIDVTAHRFEGVAILGVQDRALNKAIASIRI
jgi:hypothetical protein